MKKFKETGVKREVKPSDFNPTNFAPNLRNVSENAKKKP